MTAPAGLPLRFARVSRRFGAVVALDDVTLDVAAGESLLLLGANGAGKSTLLKIAAGLARPSSGAVEIGGTRAGRGAERALVGYLGHKTFLHDYLTAKENLVFYARLYGVSAGEADARAERWLETVGLARAADRQVRGFSRGMMQRLALARAFVHEPRLLLFDEPDAGLDADGRARLFAALDARRVAGTTVLHVSHHPEAALSHAGRVVALRAGRVVADGPAASRAPEDWLGAAAARAGGPR
ncbi:MAG: ABC transporter ATP-binding protein [Candidatus Polarisedimenticolia bacterium]